MTYTALTPTPETGPAEGVRDALAAYLWAEEHPDGISWATARHTAMGAPGGRIAKEVGWTRDLAGRLLGPDGPLARLLGAEVARVAAVERAERAEGEASTSKHLLDVRTRQMRQSNDLWCRLAEQALRGDASALRTRIEAHRNPDRSGARIVQSDALAHQEGRSDGR